MRVLPEAPRMKQMSVEPFEVTDFRLNKDKFSSERSILRIQKKKKHFKKKV